MPGVVKLAVTVKAGRLELDKKIVRQAIRSAANEVASAARRLLRASGGTGRLYRGARYGGAHRASAPGQPPSRLSGTLARSIKVRMFQSGEGATIRDAAFYAKFLEAGAHGGGGGRGGRGSRNIRRRGRRIAVTARVLEPRPFLSRALAQREASIGKRIGEAINAGVKFRSEKL